MVVLAMTIPVEGAGTSIHVAIIGAGPSGFYAAEALLRSGLSVRVDMIERLPTPFGLVRSGVAPDHPKLKEAILVYDRIARVPGFNFMGNVSVGRDVSVAELRATHHAVVFACGAETDRRMGILGEDLPGSHTATEFVGWFNGHPDYRDRAFDLSQEVVVIVGQGNVAADVCRILAKSVDQLRTTDIAEHALDALAQSKVREIHVVGRRGPAQAKFTTKELRELGEIVGCATLAEPAELALNAESEGELADRSNLNGPRNFELFRAFASRKPGLARRTLWFRFYLSPATLCGGGRVEKMVLTRNRLEGPPFAQVARPTDETIELPCGLVFRSIGYRGVPIPGLPLDEALGTVPHARGRVLDGAATLPGLYVTGWLKRGPTGIIGTNRADSVETVGSLLADLPKLCHADRRGSEALRPLLVARGVRVLSYQNWLAIDSAEIERGKPRDKPREKFTRVQEMLAIPHGQSGHAGSCIPCPYQELDPGVLMVQASEDRN
jgi:ferredoxin/flavodoxin---NADP+ reductase